MVPMAGQGIVRLQLSGTFHAQAGWLSRAMHKPYSQACENNKDAILEVLSRHLDHVEDVLEIGSGTGQHAVYFAEHLPHLTWRTSDQAVHHEGIRAWIEASGLSNVLPPLTLDVTMEPWPVESAEAVFSANTAHIMSWPMVEAFVSGVGRILARGGLFLLYGPFSYRGVHTSDSNARFDLSLRRQDPAMGVRDFHALDALARAASMQFIEDNAMPANNRLLVWRRSPDQA